MLKCVKHTFMVADHKQSFRGDDNLSPEDRARVPLETQWRDEELRRQDARKHMFPDLPRYVRVSCRKGGTVAHSLRCLCRDVIIFANFNQVCDPN